MIRRTDKVLLLAPDKTLNLRSKFIDFYITMRATKLVPKKQI